MKTHRHLIVFSWIATVQLLVTPVFAANVGHPACVAFEKAGAEQKPDYISRTASDAKTTDESGVFKAITKFFDKTPALFEGIDTSKLKWASNSLTITGQGRSPFGAIQIEIPKQDPTFVAIRIETLRGFHILDPWHMDELLRAYPTVMHHVEGKSALRTNYGEDLPNYRYFSIKTGDGNEAKTARSLVNTLLNDPENFLGGNPLVEVPQYKLPKALAIIPIVKKNAQFFGQIGEWKKIDAGLWIATQVNEVPGGTQNKTIVKIDTNTRTMDVAIEHSPFREAVVENVRRVLKATVESGLDRTLGGFPPAKISGINFVTIPQLAITQRSTAFAALLHNSMNTGGFGQPLTTLSGMQIREIKFWLKNQQLNQRDLTVPLIDLHDLVADEAKAPN